MSSDDPFRPAPARFEDPATSKSYALSGKIMLSAIVILFFVVVLMVALHLYARWYVLRARRRQLLRRRSRLNSAQRASNLVFYVDNNPTTLIAANRGLESSVLSSLPVFVYSTKAHPEPMDCAVCLSEFEEREMGRVLPKCRHSFHIECIDMWFHSHSTCPLCRAPVEPISEAEGIVSGLVAEPETGSEPGSSGPGVCEECQREEGKGNSSTASVGSRRKGVEFTGVRIEVPLRSELEDELTLSSPASGGFKSPGTRLFPMKMKTILSMGGRRTPTSAGPTTPSGAGTSFCAAELDLEKGLSESTRSQAWR